MDAMTDATLSGAWPLSMTGKAAAAERREGAWHEVAVVGAVDEGRAHRCDFHAEQRPALEGGALGLGFRVLAEPLSLLERRASAFACWWK